MSLLLRALRHVLPVVDADSALMRAVGTGLTPVTWRVPPIRMLREEVDIYLFPHLAVVEAVFDLHNLGEEMKVEVGFPAYGAQGGQFKAPDAELRDFQAVVEGLPRPLRSVRRRVNNIYFPLWRVWSQRFPARKTSRTFVRYWVPLYGYRGIARLPFTYVLRTGRYWHGRIGEAVIRVHAVDIPLRAIREAYPLGYALEPERRRLVWTFRDLYPEQDIGLLISPMLMMTASVGRSAYDPLDLHELRPPDGSRVTVAGRGYQDGTSMKLFSERCWDRNISVPDGINLIDHDMVSCEILGQEAKPLPVAGHFETLSGWQFYLASGKVAYNSDSREPFMLADEVYQLVPSEGLLPMPSLPGRFAWVSGLSNLSQNEHLRSTRWKGGSTRYNSSGEDTQASGGRCRVPHPDE